MTRIFIYSRKSRMSEKGESIKNQIEMCTEYISKSYDNPEFTIFEDEGFTGGNTDRPGFTSMLKEIKRKHADVVICYKLDRISRSVSDFSGILEVLNKYEVAFISVKEHFDTSTPIGRAMMYISSVFAQLERETIAERIRDNMKKLARTGRWLGGRTPTGFTYTNVEYLDENMNKKKLCKLVPDDDELKTVKLLFEKYLELGSQSKVITYTMLNNIKTRNDAKFCTRSIRNILSNPVYVKSDENIYYYYSKLNCDIVNDISEFNGNGLLLTNKYNQSNKTCISVNNSNEWVIAIGAHVGVIEPDIFLQVQKLLKVNEDKAPRRDTSTVALVSSLIICPDCGSKMTVSHRARNNKNGKLHYYYNCRLKMESKCTLCNSKNLNGTNTDIAIIEEMKKFSSLKRSDFLIELKDQNSNGSNKINDCINRRAVIENEIKDLDTKIQTLTCQLSENSNSSAFKYIIAQIEIFDNNIHKLKNELISIQNNLEDISINALNADMVYERLISFSNNVDNMDFEEKKVYIRELVERIEIIDGQFNIRLRL